jgi:pimeloyl-ACP methyl ester carboxylesterase
MKIINTFLFFALVAAGWVLPSAAPGADLRMDGGIRLHYETSGTGPVPVVLVHGFAMSSEVWKKAMPLFPSGYRLFAIDLKGFGRSDKPETGYTCREQADTIGAFMDSMGLSRAVLIGHSFGGLVVQHFAARHPGRVMALVLSNTASTSRQSRGLTPAAEQRIKRYGSVEENRRIFSASIPRYFDAANVSSEDIAHFVEVGLQASNAALRETLKANYASPAISASLLAAVRAPVLILTASHDPFNTFDQAIALGDAFPNSRIEVITRCGHSPMWEKPSEFVTVVTAFLKSSDVR